MKCKDYDQFPYLQFGTFLTNHDQNRVLDDFSKLLKMKAAAATSSRCPAFLSYYGEEIGMNGSGG
jgi:hypothetical protein